MFILQVMSRVMWETRVADDRFGWAQTKRCLATWKSICATLQWRHNELDGVSNHQPDDCLLNRLFRRRSKKTSKLRVTGLCAGNSPHKWPVTRKNFPVDGVIMITWLTIGSCSGSLPARQWAIIRISKIWIKIRRFSFKEKHLHVLSAWYRPLL